MGLFSRKNPFSDLKFDRKPFEDRKNETIAATNSIYDASIGEAANRSAMAGSISGVANPTRLSADTFAKITGARNEKNASIVAGYNQQAAQAETAFNRERDYKSADWESSQPTFLDYLTGASNLALGGLSIFNAVKTAFGGTQFGTGGQGISSMNSKIQGGASTPPTTFTPSPLLTPNSTEMLKGVTDKPQLNGLITPNPNLGKTKSFNFTLEKNPFMVKKRSPLYGG